MNEVLREEKKFIISQDKMYFLSHELEEFMHLDSHGDKDGYSIRSLYFDSLYNRDFVEKEDGIELRRKIRLRNYSPHSDFAMLEMKQKQGQYQKKRSLKLKKEDVLELINGNYSVLLRQGTDFANECFYMMNQFMYRPKAVITYKRKAFVAKENNIRITFDHHIKGTESYFNIFDPEINENYILDPYLAIMEVKFNGFLLSYIKDVIDKVDLPEISASKYSMGRHITQYALS